MTLGRSCGEFAHFQKQSEPESIRLIANLPRTPPVSLLAGSLSRGLPSEAEWRVVSPWLLRQLLLRILWRPIE